MEFLLGLSGLFFSLFVRVVEQRGSCSTNMITVTAGEKSRIMMPTALQNEKRRIR
jgi:hypothetical protein